MAPNCGPNRIITPMNPITTANHLCHPTCSFKTVYAKQTEINGAENVIPYKSAKGINASAFTTPVAVTAIQIPRAISHFQLGLKKPFHPRSNKIHEIKINPLNKPLKVNISGALKSVDRYLVVISAKEKKLQPARMISIIRKDSPFKCDIC